MDKGAFTARLDHASGMLFRVAWSILYNEEDCRDAMQESIGPTAASGDLLRFSMTP